ncbi:hypothetical protein [Acetobacteroides hydrogenigenes]|uniref:hypothetical protein n=1 Tax=Acetobacteroides hydrogenigenes TaxID=979970 RepID=UPI0010487B7C|nr:hypothetical protein [Acetobacteroides hydrogenigenes]
MIAEGGKPLGNNEVNVLKIENTDRITIGIATTGPIRIYWGDGTLLNLANQSSIYQASKLYSSVGNWNIVITNQENVKEILFAYYLGYGQVNKINSSVSWFLQFTNIYSITLNDATFTGDFGNVLPKLLKLERIFLRNVYGGYNTYTLNISDAKSFWPRCKFMYISSSFQNFTIGKYDDVILPIDCECAFMYSNSIYSSGDMSGFVKSGYTKCTQMGYYVLSGTLKDYPNTDDIIIPDTMTEFGQQRGLNATVPGKSAHGNLINFNFKNLTFWSCEGQYDTIDLSTNQSFAYFAKKCTVFSNAYVMMNESKYVKIPLDVFAGNTVITNLTISKFNYPMYYGVNKSYGNLDWLFSQIRTYTVQIDCGSNDGSITGTIPENTMLHSSVFGGIDITANANAIKKLLLNGPHVKWTSLPNFTGDISGADCSKIISAIVGYGLIMSNMPNLYMDITTLVHGAGYTNTYNSIILSNSIHFTGNLANIQLWGNKYEVNLSNCSYTNIPLFIRKIFTNRNTCLKAAGGMTSISVQGNSDNTSLTGIYQQPNLGTYTGNLNDLTEAQIDNLANGLDYTGTGTNTAWTDKEKIWFMVNCKNSSTDTSLRYRVTINY